jgi:hypothetical protein
MFFYKNTEIFLDRPPDRPFGRQPHLPPSKVCNVYKNCSSIPKSAIQRTNGHPRKQNCSTAWKILFQALTPLICSWRKPRFDFDTWQVFIGCSDHVLACSHCNKANGHLIDTHLMDGFRSWGSTSLCNSASSRVMQHRGSMFFHFGIIPEMCFRLYQFIKHWP